MNKFFLLLKVSCCVPGKEVVKPTLQYFLLRFHRVDELQHTPQDDTSQSGTPQGGPLEVKIESKFGINTC